MLSVVYSVLLLRYHILGSPASHNNEQTASRCGSKASVAVGLLNDLVYILIFTVGAL